MTSRVIGSWLLAVFLCACSASGVGPLADLPLDTPSIDLGVPGDVAEPDAEPEIAVDNLEPEVIDVGGEDCEPGDGCFGDPCDDNDDCNSGFCVGHIGESMCTETCEADSSCPDGFGCKAVTAGSGDVTYICVSDHTTLCRPCAEAADCSDELGSEAVCLSSGDQGGFCASACSQDADCPEGYICGDGETVDGLPVTKCTPETGFCQCSALSIELALQTPCAIKNDFGSCDGARFCGPEGLTDCDATTPEEEGCDGADNDCDGEIDEELGATTCGVGECEHSVENCVSGQTQACDPLEGAEGESCDGLDNDCNGEVDDTLGTTVCGLGACEHAVENCVEGLDQDCDPMEGATDEGCDGADNDCDGETDEELGQTTCGLGACEHTVQNCAEGVSQVCDALEGASVELCDGTDNDCDGETDEELGTTECGLGACKQTVANCNDGSPQFCNPFEGALPEVCDGEDNDCDGEQDEDLGQTSCGLGACLHTIESCLNGGDQVCDPLAGASDEVCDGADNDCDGEKDEGLGETSCGLGLCAHATQNCSGGEVQVCDPFQGAAEEVCDGLDNDCDGETDEELGTTECGLGVCAHEVANCLGGVPQFCNPFAGASAESCDGEDNDCDGETDEDLGTTSCGFGPCEHAVDNCVAGVAQACDPLEGVTEEVCDSVDNDCDGLVDNGLGTTTCGLGNCEHTIDKCSGGELQDCDPFEGVSAEICDGFDNDCDNATDEELGSTTCGQGECAHTVTNCSEGVVQFCDPFAGAADEICDGADNNCNGSSDEDLGNTTCGLGACEHTVANCVDGQTQLCDAFEGATDEICDGLNNDCDEETDEELGQTTCGFGVCEHTIENCVSGLEQVCNPFEGASLETCDGLDNDCDEEEDEDLGETTCGQGPCLHTVSNCANAEIQICDPFEGAEEDVCDGVDNDCTGVADEGCPALGEQVENPEFNDVSGQVCGSGIHAGPSDIGGTWMAFVRDTHPSNNYGCGNMCAGADGGTGYAGGSNGAGCNAWVYQCVPVPYYSKISLSYRYRTSSGYGGTAHRVVMYEECSNGPPDGDVYWKPYGGETIMENSEKPGGWTNYQHDLTEALVDRKGKSVFIGLYTNNSWAASYSPQSWIDDVHLVAE